MTLLDSGRANLLVSQACSRVVGSFAFLELGKAFSAGYRVVGWVESSRPTTVESWVGLEDSTHPTTSSKF